MSEPGARSAAPEVLLTNGDEVGPERVRRFDPGGLIRGVVRASDHPRLPTRGVRAVARWRAQGRGGLDAGSGPDVFIHRGSLGMGRVDLPFEYPLPIGPWSYQGQLVRIEWWLEIRLDLPRAADRPVSVPFILAPPPPGEAPNLYPGAATAKTTGQ